MLKVSLKNLWGHKTRFISTFIAVVIGVGFLSGVLVFTDTIKSTFNSLFTEAAEGTDAAVRQADSIDAGFGMVVRGLVDSSLADQISQVDGVSAAVPSIAGTAQMLTDDGELVGGGNQGPPTLGGNWIGDERLDPFRLVEGTAPAGPGEVIIDRGSSKDNDLGIGDRITIVTATGSPETFTVSGIVTFGTANSPLGASVALFEQATAERLLTEPGRANHIAVAADDGVDQETIVARIQAGLPEGLEAITGDQLTEETQDQISTGLSFITIFFTIFAAIAVVVGAFVIYNSFSIIMSQRTREMALLRALGASRRQVLSSVVVESIGVGLLASVAGIAIGAGLAMGLRELFAASGVDLPGAGLVLKRSTITTGMVVGLITTIGSAMYPAVKASRVPPLAAIRDVAVEDTRISKVRVGIGVVLVALGLLGVVQGSGLAALLVIGAIVMGPVVAGPIAAALGAPIARTRGIAGALARQNAMRSPRRTAGTASAVLFAVGVVSAMVALAGSINASITESVNRAFVGDVVIEPGTMGMGGLSPALAQAVGELPDVAESTGLRSTPVRLGDDGRFITAFDPVAGASLMKMDVSSGDITTLGADGIAVASREARNKELSIGSTVTITFPDSGPQEFTVRALFDSGVDLSGSYVVGNAAFDAHVVNPVDSQILVKFRDGVDTAAARATLEDLARPYANAEVKDSKELAKTYTSQIDQLLVMVGMLLVFAIIIALVGIANTLKLSIYERTRELGLLRAVGMVRSQMRSSVRWESAIVAVFGTVGGVSIGVLVAWAAIRSFTQEGSVTIFAPNWGMQITVLVLGAIAGVLAAVRPASRAAKLDVLEAIATD